MFVTPDEFLARVAGLCEEMTALQDQASQALSQADKAVSEIYHDVEFTRFDAAEGYMLARRLKEALQHRRAVKVEQSRLNVFAPLVHAMTQRQRDTQKRLSQWEARQADLAQRSTQTAEG